jgi:hypothetical protein
MKEQPHPVSTPQHEKFTKALASVLAVKPSELRDKLAEAKDEPPSPHTKYSYSPEVDRS